MRKVVAIGVVVSIFLVAPSRDRVAASSAEMHSCRLPENGIEATYTVALFVSCVPKAQQCAQAVQSFTPPKNLRVIKGFPHPFLRPWDSNGNPNRCDPKGNTDVPCWAASEQVVYKRAPNKKCLSDSD